LHAPSIVASACQRKMVAPVLITCSEGGFISTEGGVSITNLRSTGENQACQIAVHREFGRVHLVPHRAHAAVRRLGAQQVLQQPP
jgi:hypothetical protein